MRAITRIVYLVCFIGLMLVAAFALNRAAQSSMATVLVRSVFIAAMCAAPGLVYRRLWPLALLLLPVGCYVLIRTIMPLPILVDSVAQQYSYYTEQLGLGVTTYKNAVFPLEITGAPELRLLLAFVVYWLTGVAAFLALSLRRPTPALVFPLTLLGYSFTVDSYLRELWPAFLFMILAACLLVLSRSLKREVWRLRDAVVGGSVGVVAALLAFALLAAAPSVVATPWRDWRTWDPFDESGSVYTFNWLQNYPRLLNPANDVVVMSVESELPSYWRASSLDSFTGTAWVTSQAFLESIEGIPQGQSDETGRYPSYVYEIPTSEPTPEGRTVTQTFHIQSVYTNYFFTGGDPHSLTIDQDIPLRMNRMRSLRVNSALGPTLRYSVVAVVPEITPADLVGLGTDYSSELDEYLTLPFDHVDDIEGTDKETTWRNIMADKEPDGWEWADLYTLNREIVGDATDPYQITLRIEQYLRRFYTYSLTPPASEYSSPYAAFLFEGHTGYCQHFAGAMALLLRYNGIPCRVAVGFTSGEAQDEDTYFVSTNNAHAWVEVFFPTVGWVGFDPTPGQSLPTAGASSTSPGFVNPFSSSSTSGTGSATTRPTQNGLPNDEESRDRDSGVAKGDWLNGAAWVPWVAAIILLTAGWPVARGLWWQRRLHRGSLEQRLQASLSLLQTELSLYTAPVTPSQTLEEVVAMLHTHLGIDNNPDFIEQTNAVLFGGRSARIADIRRAETLRREVKTRLRKRHGWVRTVRVWYGLSQFPRRGRTARTVHI